MSEETQQPVDLEAFAKKVAEETAAKIAMKQAEQKAAEEAVQKEAEEKATAEAEVKAQQEEQVQSAIRTGIESGTERLLKDLEARMTEKDAKIDEVMREHEEAVKEKSEEIEKMRESKRVFADRGTTDLNKSQKEQLLHASILGKITKKGWDTDYAKEVLQKAGVDYGTASTSGNIDLIVANTFEEEVRQEQKVAPAFRELQVNSGATVMPIAPDTESANWNGTGLETAANLLEESGASDNNYTVGNVTLRAHRLVSGTYIANDVEEQVVITMLPIITSALARAHAKAIDAAIMVGNSSGITGLAGGAGTDGAGSPFAGDWATTLNNNGSEDLAAANLMAIRATMGKYGLSPEDLVYIVNNEEYFNLISDAAFSDVSEVGNDTAMKLIGAVGSLYGTPVIVTDTIARGAGKTAAVAVAKNNYVIPRLKGVSIETDYEVAGQRTAVVAAQSLGFGELVDAAGGNLPSVRIQYSG